MKRIIVYILIVTSALIANAQIRIQTPEQSLISATINNAFVTVSRSYVVRDKESGETYKRDGRNDFNEVQSFGIRIKGGLIVPSTIDRPWEKDTSFTEYNNWYDGVARRFTAKMPTGKVVIDSNLNIASCNKENMLYTVSLENSDDGLVIDTTKGKVNGWIVLWMTDNDTATTTSSFRKEVVLSSEKEMVEIDKPHTTSNIIGGVFVNPLYPTVGVIEFRLSGVVMDGGEKLQIIRPSIKSIPAKAVESKREQTKQEQARRPSLKGLSPVPATPDKTIDGGKTKDNKKGKKK